MACSFYAEAEQGDELKDFGWFDFYQPNATINLAYDLSTRRLLEMSALSADQFHEQLTSGVWDPTSDDTFRWSPTSLYNPTGKMLLSLANASLCRLYGPHP